MTKVKPLAPDRQGKIFFVDSRRLKFKEGFNKRIDYGDLVQFWAEIKAGGLDSLDPLTCYKEGEFWIVIKGHRRTEAIRIGEKEGLILMVPIIRARNGYNYEKSILQQIAQNHKDYTPLEKAAVVSEMRSLGWSEKDMIKESGLTDVYIRRLLLLADAPKKLLNLVREGTVKGTFAMDMIAEGRVDELLQKAEKNELSPLDPDKLPFPDVTPVTAATRITRSDLPRPASFKKVHKWAKAIDESVLPPEKKEAYSLWQKWLNGDLTEEDFKNFFQ